MLGYKFLTSFAGPVTSSSDAGNQYFLRCDRLAVRGIDDSHCYCLAKTRKAKKSGIEKTLIPARGESSSRLINFSWPRKRTNAVLMPKRDALHRHKPLIVNEDSFREFRLLMAIYSTVSAAPDGVVPPTHHLVYVDQVLISRVAGCLSVAAIARCSES